MNSLEWGYFLLTVSVVLTTAIIGRNVIVKAFPENNKSIILKFLVILIGWNIYLYAMSQTEFIKDFSFPPKFFLFLILPVFIFTGLFTYQNRNKKWLQAISPQTLFYVQGYRLFIELLFVFTVAARLIPPHVTIEGYNFDMIFATITPIIGYLTFNKNILSTKFALRWNFLGLMVIASIIILFQTSIYLPELYTSDIVITTKFVSYPYVLVPGFLMPLAVFIHVLSITQLYQRVKSEKITSKQ